MKCHQYYPDSGSLSFGPITVTLIDSMPLADFTIRILKLEMVSSYFAVPTIPPSLVQRIYYHTSLGLLVKVCHVLKGKALYDAVNVKHF